MGGTSSLSDTFDKFLLVTEEAFSRGFFSTHFVNGSAKSEGFRGSWLRGSADGGSVHPTTAAPWSYAMCLTEVGLTIDKLNLEISSYSKPDNALSLGAIAYDPNQSLYNQMSWFFDDYEYAVAIIGSTIKATAEKPSSDTIGISIYNYNETVDYKPVIISDTEITGFDHAIHMDSPEFTMSGVRADSDIFVFVHSDTDYSKLNIEGCTALADGAEIVLCARGEGVNYDSDEIMAWKERTGKANPEFPVSVSVLQEASISAVIDGSWNTDLTVGV